MKKSKSKRPTEPGEAEKAMMKALEAKTNLSAPEIQEQLDNFKKMCPDGMVGVGGFSRCFHPSLTSCLIRKMFETIK